LFIAGAVSVSLLFRSNSHENHDITASHGIRHGQKRQLQAPLDFIPGVTQGVSPPEEETNTVTTQPAPPIPTEERQPPSSSDTSTKDDDDDTDDAGEKIPTHAVVSLISNRESDLLDFCQALKSLTRHAIVTMQTPILIFTEVTFTHAQKYMISECTPNPHYYHLADLSFPADFDARGAYNENDQVALQGTRYHRAPWGYAQMIRFWTSQVWKHPAVQEYKNILRLDTDSCFTGTDGGKNGGIWKGLKQKYVYRSEEMGVGVNTFINYLYDFTVSYLETHSIKPKNRKLWSEIKNMWAENRTLPMYHKSFEVSRVSFFLRPDVMQWHEALTDGHPFGVFRYRWSDAHTKVLTMALFAKKGEVLLRKHAGFVHGRGVCNELAGWPEEVKTQAPKYDEEIRYDGVIPSDQEEIYAMPNNEEANVLPEDGTSALEINPTIDTATNANIQPSKHAIVTLLVNDGQSVNNFCYSIQTLVKNSIITYEYPILIFTTDDFTQDKRDFLKDCGERANLSILFNTIEWDFPPHFDAQSEYAKYPMVANQGIHKSENRQPWGYVKMIRFWTTTLWRQTWIGAYDTIMRFDSDSCFVAPSENDDLDNSIVPGMQEWYLYRTDQLRVGAQSWIEKLYEFTVNYMQLNKIVPKNMKLWEHIKNTWENEQSLPIFTKNFEVVRVNFFTRPEVMKWHESLTELEPYGVFRYRWSDAQTRVITLALFAESDELLIHGHPGYRHGMGECREYLRGEGIMRPQGTVPQQEEERPPLPEVALEMEFPTEMENNFIDNGDQQQQEQQYQQPPVVTDASTNNQNAAPMLPEFPPVDHQQYAIATLVENDPTAINHYCLTLASLHKNDIIKPENPLLIFHDDDFLPEQRNFLQSCTMNKITFYNANLGSVPELNVRPENGVELQGTKKTPSRQPWGYVKMIRFWTSGIWTVPSIKEYATIMRLDMDSCFVSPRDADDLEDYYVPGIRGRYLYRTDKIMTTDASNTWIEGLYDFTVEYMRKENINPRNADLWNVIQSTWNTQKTLPLFSKNFEVVSTKFFLRPEVMQWHQALTEQDPFGVFAHRWSDSQTRVITLALFAEKDQLLIHKHPGYRHGVSLCEDYWIDIKGDKKMELPHPPVQIDVSMNEGLHEGIQPMNNMAEESPMQQMGENNNPPQSEIIQEGQQTSGEQQTQPMNNMVEESSMQQMGENIDPPQNEIIHEGQQTSGEQQIQPMNNMAEDSSMQQMGENIDLPQNEIMQEGQQAGGEQQIQLMNNMAEKSPMQQMGENIDQPQNEIMQGGQQAGGEQQIQPMTDMAEEPPMQQIDENMDKVEFGEQPINDLEEEFLMQQMGQMGLPNFDKFDRYEDDNLDEEQQSAPVNESNNDEQQSAPVNDNNNDEQQPPPDIPNINRSNHAVVTLVENDENSLNKYCYALQSLTKNYIVRHENPVIVFHEEDFPQDAKDFIRQCTTNPVEFDIANFGFPEGFDADKEFATHEIVANQGKNKGGMNRKPWSYVKMIRFWTSAVWRQSLLSNYRTVMRLDMDSCFVKPGDGDDVDNMYVPGLRPRYMYRTDDLRKGGSDWIDGLADFAIDYVARENITPLNPELWEHVLSTWREDKVLPIFTKNFEVMRVEFFLRPEVMKWHEALTDHEPYGVFRERWSDAQTRVMTMALFAEPGQLLVHKHLGYRHGVNQCQKYYEYLESLSG